MFLEFVVCMTDVSVKRVKTSLNDRWQNADIWANFVVECMIGTQALKS